MPLIFNEEQRKAVLKNRGYDPAYFDIDANSGEVYLRPNPQQPQAVEPQPDITNPPPVNDKPGMAGSFGRNFVAGIVPSLGGMAGIRGGAAIGARIGAFGGPVGAGVGAVVGGIGGGFLGSATAARLQDYLLPDKFKESLALDSATNPGSSLAGGLASQVVGFSPNLSNVGKAIGTVGKLGERALVGSKLARPFMPGELANLGNVGGGAALGAGSSIYEDVANDQPINARNLLMSAAGGALLNEPNKLVGQGIFKFEPTAGQSFSRDRAAKLASKIEPMLRDPNAAPLSSVAPELRNKMALEDVASGIIPEGYDVNVVPGSVVGRKLSPLDSINQKLLPPDLYLKGEKLPSGKFRKADEIRPLKSAQESAAVMEAIFSARDEAANAAKMAQEAKATQARQKFVLEEQLKAASQQNIEERGATKTTKSTALVRENNYQEYRKAMATGRFKDAAFYKQPGFLERLQAENRGQPTQPFEPTADTTVKSMAPTGVDALGRKIKREGGTYFQDETQGAVDDISLDAAKRLRKLAEENRVPLKLTKDIYNVLSKEVAAPRSVKTELNPRLKTRGQVDVESGIAQINPETATPDTVPHETFHKFVRSLENSPIKADQDLIEFMKNKVADSSEFRGTNARREAAGLPKFDVEEFLTENVGYDAIRRLYNLDKESGTFKSGWRDFLSRVKTRFGRGNIDDISRIASERMLEDVPDKGSGGIVKPEQVNVRDLTKEQGEEQGLTSYKQFEKPEKYTLTWSSDDSFYTSSDGRFEINPKYIGRERPQGWTLKDKLSGASGEFFDLKSAKEAASNWIVKQPEHPAEAKARVLNTEYKNKTLAELNARKLGSDYKVTLLDNGRHKIVKSENLKNQGEEQGLTSGESEIVYHGNKHGLKGHFDDKLRGSNTGTEFKENTIATFLTPDKNFALKWTKKVGNKQLPNGLMESIPQPDFVYPFRIRGKVKDITAKPFNPLDTSESVYKALKQAKDEGYNAVKFRYFTDDGLAPIEYAVFNNNDIIAASEKLKNQDAESQGLTPTPKQQEIHNKIEEQLRDNAFKSSVAAQQAVNNKRLVEDRGGSYVVSEMLKEFDLNSRKRYRSEDAFNADYDNRLKEARDFILGLNDEAVKSRYGEEFFDNAANLRENLVSQFRESAGEAMRTADEVNRKGEFKREELYAFTDEENIVKNQADEGQGLKPVQSFGKEDDVAVFADKNADAAESLADGANIYTITKSTREPGKWQRTEFILGENDAIEGKPAVVPIGHSTYDSYVEAVNDTVASNYRALTKAEKAKIRFQSEEGQGLVKAELFDYVDVDFIKQEQRSPEGLQIKDVLDGGLNDKGVYTGPPDILNKHRYLKNVYVELRGDNHPALRGESAKAVTTGNGEGTIYLNEKYWDDALNGKDPEAREHLRKVIIHELTHFIQDKENRLDGYGYDRKVTAAAEREANDNMERYQANSPAQGLTTEDINKNFVQNRVKLDKGFFDADENALIRNLRELPFGVPGLKSDIDKLELRAGPSGKYAAPAFRELFAKEAEYNGRYTNPALEAQRKLSGPEKDLLMATMLSEKRQQKSLRDTLPKKLQEAYDIHRELFNLKQQDQIAANQPVMDIDSQGRAVPRQAKIDPFYFPEVTGGKQLDILLNRQGSEDFTRLKNDFMEHVKAKYNLNEEAAQNLFQEMLSSYGGPVKGDTTKFGAVRKAEGIGLPDSWIESDMDTTLRRYWRRVAKDRSFHDAIETDDNLLHLMGRRYNPWGEAIKPSRKDDLPIIAGNETLSGILDTVQGQSVKSNPRLDAVSRIVNNLILGPITGVNDAINAIPLTLKFAPSMTDIPKIVADSILNVRQGIINAKKTGRIRENLASLEDGFLPHTDSVERLRSFASTLSKISGRDKLENFSRGLSQAASESIITIQRRLAMAGDRKADKFLFNLANNKNWTKMSDAQLAARIVDLAQGTYDVRGLPSWVIDSPVAPILRLAKWNIEQLNNFHKYAVVPAIRDKNPVPLITTLLGGTIGGMIAKEVREYLSNKESQIPSWMEIKNADVSDTEKILPITYNLAAALSYSGVMGTLGEIVKGSFDAAFENRPQGYNYPMIEILSDAVAKTFYAIEAMTSEGESPVNVIPAYAADMLGKNIQLGRIGFNWMKDLTGDPGKANTESRRDLRVWRQLEGLPVAASGEPTGENPYIGLKLKAFKQARSVPEALEIGRPLVKSIIEENRKDPVKLQTELSKLKRNSFQTIPSPERNPILFKRYYDFLVKTKGETEARKKLAEYFNQRAVNKAKSSMVP